MTVTISDTAMTSDRSHCTARHSSDRNGWEVSWLPGQVLDRNSAITAMTLADTAAEHDLDDGHPLWPAIQSWAAEVGLTAHGALSRISQPPDSMSAGKDSAAELADPEAAG